MGSERTDGTVIVIGYFDGVHLGHRALIGRARAIGDERGLPVIAVTFDPHPLATVRPSAVPRSLATLDERIALLQEAGADEVDVLRFDTEFSRQSPQEFAQRIIVERLCARVVVVGANFRFGAGAAGDVHTLAELGHLLGFDTVVEELRSDTEPWSSTRVRQHLAAGEISEGNRILGRPYDVNGIVVHGDHRGRELGYPTANVHFEGVPVIPADGVYAGWLHAQGERMAAAISIGTNPQFDGQDRRIEAYAIDRVGLDLYGQQVEVEFTEYLRPQGVFESLDVFMEQMAADVQRARRVLGQ